MTDRTVYGRLARVLHWTMAPLILATLFIGGAMTTALRLRPWLLDVHVSLGLLLALALLRLANRLRSGTPDPPDTLAPWEIRIASLTHGVLYALMLLQPLVGWAVMSAGGVPVTLGAGISLPPILPADPWLYGALRTIHAVQAYALLVLILLHVSAALRHRWILRDGVFARMWRR